MVGIGLERRLVPELGLVVPAQLAVGVADIIGDVGMLVMAERVHGGDAGVVPSGQDQFTGGAVVAQEFRLLFSQSELLLLLLDGAAFLVLLLAVVGRRRVVGAHRVQRLGADGGHQKRGNGKHGEMTQHFNQGRGLGHGRTSWGVSRRGRTMEA